MPKSSRKGPESRVVKFLRGFKTALSEIWRETPGKVALVLLVFLLALATIAATSITPDFLLEWESVTYWEDNPVVVPPCWINRLGFRTPQTAQVYLQEPVYTSINPARGEVAYTFSYNYTLDVDTPPKDIYIKVQAPMLCESTPDGNITYKLPIMVVAVERPDGIVLTPWRLPLRLQPNQTLECGRLLSGEKTTKETFDVATAVTLLQDKYNATVPVEVVGENKTYQLYANAILRTVVRRELEGRYMTVLTIFVHPDRVTVELNRDTSRLERFRSDIKGLNESISALNIRQDYKNRIISSLNLAYSNITWLIENINTVTYTDYLNTLYNASGELQAVQRLALRAGIPVEIRNQIGDLVTSLSKFIDSATMTTEVLSPAVSFKALQGVYRINVSLVYLMRTPPEAIKAEVGIIVKGGCYGLLGTAHKGIDVFRVLLYGTPIALAIGFITAVASVFIGVIAGIVSGYYGGFTDEFIQRTVDVLGNIPFLPILIIIGSMVQGMYTGPLRSLYIILTYMIILIIFGWGGLAITVRAMTLSIKEEPYIEAARALGASNTRIIFKHIFPQVLMYATAVLVFRVPDAILTEAGLSVLGLRHGWPTWGSLLADARAEYRYDVWWWIFPPGIMISLTSLTFILLGLAIERIVEPRLRTL
jgi:peptide/nickel transport system permease protein